MAYFKLPSGVRDVLPAECRALNAAEDRLGRKFSEAGFRFIRTAGLEYFDTFAGIKSSVEQSKMFKMTDKDGNLIVLRPDMTLACARIAATKLHKDRAKVCYFSNIYDFAAGGNSDREVAQAGVEIFGEEGAFSDAYVVAFAAECLREIGLKDFIIDIGHVGFYKGLLEGSGLSEEGAEEIRGYINAKDALNVEIALKEHGASERAQAAILALPSLFGGVSVLEDAKKLTGNPLALRSLEHLQKVYGYLREMGAEKCVSFDLGSVKSLAYYSGMVFTGLAEGVGAPVLSGGRYDGLCAQFGKDLSAVGFAIGMGRALRALGGSGEAFPCTAVICKKGGEAAGYRFYRKLLSEGRRCDLFAGEEETVPEGYEEVYAATAEGVRKC